MRRPSSSNLDEAWHRHRDADVLFHYTTAEGLRGVLSSGCLWATDVRYLNDTVEFEYGRRLAIEKLLGIRERVAFSSAHVREVSEAIQALERVKPRVFAASLAVGGDLLSLWRGYCRPRDAYAIGFDRRALQRVVQRRNCRLECVIYSPGAQWECLHSVEAEAARRSGPLPSRLQQEGRDCVLPLVRSNCTSPRQRRAVSFSMRGRLTPRCTRRPPR